MISRKNLKIFLLLFYSDEAGCPCSENDMFKCTQGPCIPNAERCNSQPDCIDASDEKDCDKKECPKSLHDQATMINCNRTTACILPEW